MVDVTIAEAFAGIAALGGVFAAVNSWRTAKKNIIEDSPIIIHIQSDVQELLRVLARNEQRLQGIADVIDGIKERLIIAEQSTKSAHRRLDALEGARGARNEG
ncbi:MAG: hypothetical protein LBU67_05845 [Oscillospiraceae bacterium]|nr:hypothetical protein [Oscillospiraceae bacterium]